jgi:hypothetical protein
MSGPGATTYIIIDNYLIDCSISETHTFDADVTDYPVESGSNISDNIRPLPVQVDIEGLVSNTPIGLIRDSRSTDVVHSDDAYERLQRIRELRQPVTIMTSLRTFDNMALQSLVIPKGDHMDGLRFQAKFKQIISVENKRTIRVSIPIGSNKGGKAVTKPGTPYGSRILLIDKVHDAWFDPDYGKWRNGVKYVEGFRIGFQETGSSTFKSYDSKWHLYRNAFRDDLYQKAYSVGDPNDTTVLNGLFHTIVAVELNRCVLHDFVIQTKPGEQAINAPVASSLTGRTQ